MRGTVAKRLRKTAAVLARASNIPQRYHRDEDTLNIRMSPNCERAIYQRIKAKHNAWLKQRGN